MAASRTTRPLLIKNLLYRRGACVLCLRGHSSSAAGVVSTSKDVEGHIQQGEGKVPRGQVNIPKKKKRDSLSVLKALASTVRRDPTAPDYSFMDDPYMIPATPKQKKLALLSKASGKRTARYIVNEFRNTFDHDAAAPHVPAFQPDKKGYEHTDLSADSLAERIDRRAVKDAIEVYERMKEEGIEVPADTQLAFLELLCVFSCKDPVPHLMPEEKVLDNLVDDQATKLSMELADDVFQTLPEKSADAYNWIVRGLLKVGDSKGLIYYKEMVSANIPVDLGTYNELISSLSQKKKLQWDDIQNILTEMKNSVFPNLDTFHRVLKVMASLPRDPQIKAKVPAVIAEMKTLDINPTLHTWSMVLSVLSTGSTERPNEGHGIMTDILDIINYLKADVDQIYTGHAKENFFVKAMQECKRYRDSETALALFQLKEDLANRYVITSLTDEVMFYDDLLTLLAKTELPDVMMDIYSKVCPNHHSIGRNSLSAMLSNLEMYQEYRYVIQLWDDADLRLQLGFMERIIQQFLELFASENVPSEIGKHFAQIARKLFDERLQMDKPTVQDGILFTHLITIFLNNGQLDNAWEAMMKFVQNEYAGFIRYDKLVSVLAMSIKEGDEQKIMSFCELPEAVRSTMLTAGAEVVKQNEEILTQVLTQDQLQQLEDCFPPTD